MNPSKLNVSKLRTMIILLYMKFKIDHQLLLLFLSLSALVGAISVPRAISPNQKYLTIQTLEVSTVNNNLQPTDWNPLIYTLPFPPRFQQISPIQVFFTLSNFSVSYPDNHIDFHGRIAAKNETGIQYNIYSTLPENIHKLVYRYLIISGEYASLESDFTNLITMEIDFILNETTVSGSRYSKTFDLPYQLQSGMGSRVSYYSSRGFHAYSNTSLYFRSNMSISVSTSTINIYWYNSYSVPDLDGVHYLSLLIYNSEAYRKQKFAKFSSSQIYMGSSPVSKKWMNQFQLYEPNTFLFLNSITASTSDTHITIGYQFISNYIYSVQFGSTFGNTYIQVISMFTYYCDYRVPYYELASDQCYDSCPDGTTKDDLNLLCCPSNCNQCNIKGQCIACPSDCRYCTLSGECLECSPEQHRYLSNGRCIPQKGYFQNDLNQIQQCPEECTECSSRTLCTQCGQEYQLIDGRCSKAETETEVAEQQESFFESETFSLSIKIGIATIFVIILIIIMVVCCKRCCPSDDKKEEVSQEPRSAQGLFKRDDFRRR